jgi:uncharacterized repeat protein (TIGR02543 family)
LDLSYNGVWYANGGDWINSNTSNGTPRSYIGKPDNENKYYRTKIKFTTGELYGTYSKLVISITPNQNSSPGYTTAVLSTVDVSSVKIYDSSDYASSDPQPGGLKENTITSSYAYNSSQGTTSAGLNNKNTFYYILNTEIQSNTTYYVYLRRGGHSTHKNSTGWVGFNVSSISIKLDDNSYTANTYKVSYDELNIEQVKKHNEGIIVSLKPPTNYSTKYVYTTFDTQGGTPKPSPVRTAVITSKPFLGWFSSSDEKTYKVGDTYSHNADTTMTSQWGTQEVVCGSVTLPEVSKKGYSFDGWYLGNTKQTSYAPSENSTLTAKWTPEKYTVTFDVSEDDVDDVESWAGGWDNGNPIKSVTFGISYGDFPKLKERSGYAQEDWLTDIGTTIDTECTVNIARDHTVRPQWIANEYRLYLHKDDTEDSIWTKKIVTYDQSYRLPTEYKAGHNFKGWVAKGNNETQEIPQNGIWTYIECASADIVDGAYDIHLYPKWEKSTVRIIYNAYGKRKKVSAPIGSYDALKTPNVMFMYDVEHHHKLTGWYTATGVKIADWDTILNGATTKDSDGYPIFNVYAKYEPRFKLYYIADDGAIKKLSLCYVDKNGTAKRLYPYVKK